jgi:redox-sensitive bicupin YhaK (pirin superfamily)
MAAAAAAPASLALAQDNLVKPRTVVQRVAAVETQDGDGARVRRTLGTAGLRQLSPFLMLDHFTVTPPAGFPPHPHRGQVRWRTGQF